MVVEFYKVIHLIQELNRERQLSIFKDTLDM
jgi:hypothetical protein